jgi:acetoin utilization protein AcuB
MKVQDLMQTRVFTVSENDTVDRVFFLIHYEKIRHLPVVDRKQVVGIVSDRDLYKALGPRAAPEPGRQASGETSLYVIPKRVRHIMRRGVFTIAPEAPAAEAASLMARRKIGALPVTKKSRLVGIVTATDLLRAFAQLVAELNRLTGR